MGSQHKYFNPKATGSPHKYFNHHHAKHYLFLLYMLSHDDIKNFVVQNNVLGYAIAIDGLGRLGRLASGPSGDGDQAKIFNSLE